MIIEFPIYPRDISSVFNTFVDSLRINVSVTDCRFGFILLICLSAVTTVLAQVTPPSRVHLTTVNGLPNNSVTGMGQDRAGFVWVATCDGLARYDGRTVKVFRNRPSDSFSLADNHITELLSAPDGTFILNMESGTVQQFDPTTERFTTMIHRKFMDRNKILFNRIQLSANGKELWGLLPGVRLIRYDIRRKSLRVFNVPDLVGSVNELHDFILTPSGHIYGETLAGLFQFDTRTGRKRIIPFPFKTIDRERGMGFWSLNNHQVALGPNGQIAVFGYDVIALYDPVRARFRTVPIPNVVKPRTNNARKLATVISYGLKTLADNHLYIGYMNRLYRLDAADRLTLVRRGETPTGRLAPWLIDRSGVLWVSGEATGLMKLELHPLPFDFLPKRKSFNEDLLEQHLSVALPKSYEFWDNDNWPRFTMDHVGTGYLIDPSRVYRYTVATRTLTEVAKFAAIDGMICCKLCLKTGTDGQIWVYNNRRGLITVSPDETKGYAWPHSRLPLTNLNPGFDAGDIQPMGRSVWIGGQHELGLFRYDLHHKRFDKPLLNDPGSVNSLAANTINCLSADPADSTTLWIGTAGGGLCRLDTRTMRFWRLGESEGFPNGTIQSMETDDQGMLWCATNKGLVRLNPNAKTPQTLTWRHFTTDDGLAENAFLPTASARLPDGRLVFGTPKGRVAFDPGAIRDKGFEPPIVLNSLLVNNKPVEAGGPNVGPSGLQEPQYALPAPLNTLTELVLDHTQNFLTIAFAGLDYGKSEKLTYRYQLTGVDDGWVMIGTQNTANYTQLAPGHYLFRVNSTTADGRWSQQIKQLAIVITPPFWATWWAYGIYALAFVGLVLGFIRFRIGQAQQQQALELKRRETEQLRAVDEVKTRFFSNITHEFRTPLTLILSPTEKLLRQPEHSTVTRQVLASVHENARQLLRLINQLLDLAKLEGGSMRVASVRGNALAFVQRLAETLQPLAVSRGVLLKIVAPENAPVDGQWLFDDDKWEKILTNLLANALKFTPAGGQVILALTHPTDGKLLLRLTDTGVGIPAQHIPHIFDRFYQADTSQTRSYEGTGIGLALVKELIDLLGGTITVQSRTEAPTGTTFTFTLPLQPATNRIDGIDVPELVLPGDDATAFRLPNTVLKPTDREPTPPVADDAPLVLIVEDNEELRSFIAGDLMNRYRVQMAADGQEGWELCQQELPDVVIADVMMPRMDGYQLTNRIKSTPATNHIAVMLLTARAAHESRIIGLEQGADDYLTKPFHTDELSLRLDNMLTRLANLRAYLHRQLSMPMAIDEPVDDPFVGLLHQVIEARLDDPALDVGELAEAVAMSRRTLNRKLAVTADLSAIEFIRNYRLQRAAQLLKEGLSVSEIAYSVGFESPSYFAKVFKQIYHQTPTEFQNK